MNQIKITTKTPEQISAAFAAAVKSFEAKRPTQATRLEPYRAEIMKLRRRGYTWKEVARVMSDPQIGEKVSDKLLITVFGGKADKEAIASKTGEASAPKTGEATAPGIAPAAAPASNPASRRLILDPLTGQRIS